MKTSALDTIHAVAPTDRHIDGERWNISHSNPFACAVRVGPSHISNVIEHVSNIEYVRWIDRASELHGDAVGCSRADLLQDGVMWFVARHEIDYLAEAWLNDDLVLVTWIDRIRKVKAWRSTVILRLDDDVEICRATTLWVLVDLKIRRPARVPEHMVHAFAPVSGED